MNEDNAGCLFFLGLIAAVIFVYWSGGVNNAWYSVRFVVSPDKVTIQPKPRDCDFMTSPLGDKGCHYEAVAFGYNAAGNLVGGDNAPIYSRDSKEGKPIISFDNGKTWEWYRSTELPKKEIERVSVDWKRIKD